MYLTDAAVHVCSHQCFNDYIHFLSKASVVLYVCMYCSGVLLVDICIYSSRSSEY